MAGIAAVSVGATEVAIAERGHDAQLRALLRRSVMPGKVSLAMTREPDYFAADGLAGADDLTLVSRQDGRIVGMGRLSVTSLMRNGELKRIGYLGALRITNGARQSVRMLRDGYELLVGNIPAPVDGYFTSIAFDNERARQVLENGTRFGLPVYRPLCELVTLVMPAWPMRNTPTTASEPELLAFLHSASSGSQLALSWDAERLRNLGKHGVDFADFCVVRQGSEIVGSAAVWDQRSFKQTVITGYAGALDTFLPVYNLVQGAFRRRPLPPPNSVLSQAAMLGAFVAEPDDWKRLWPVISTKAAQRGVEWLTVSRDTRDPELPVLRRLTRATEYRTVLYEVEWRDGPRWPDSWNGACFRPEVGLL